MYEDQRLSTHSKSTLRHICCSLKATKKMNGFATRKKVTKTAVLIGLFILNYVVLGEEKAH